MTARPHYTQQELDTIRLLFEAGKSDEEIAQALGRPLTGVKVKRVKLRLLRPDAVEISLRTAHRWTKEEEEFILNFWREKSDKWMARKLGVTIAQYSKKRCKMKYYADGKNERCIKTWTQQKGKRQGWTFNQEEFLKEYYPTHSAEEIGRYLGKKPNAVQTKAHRMGIKKAYIAGYHGYPPIEQYYDTKTFTPKTIK